MPPTALAYVLLAVALLAGVSTTGLAVETAQPAAPSVELSRYVSPDVGLCLEFRQLETHTRRFVEGELYRRLQNFPPFAAILEQQRPHWAAIAGEVERRTGATVEQLYTGLLGRQVLFAVWPPAEGRSPKGDALLLIEAADRDLLNESLRRLVEARRSAGRWHGRRTIEAVGQTFAIEVIARDDEPTDIYLAVDGALGIMATSEAVVRGVIERRGASATDADSLASLAAYQAAVGRLSTDCVARVFISPRAWDAALLADLARKPPGSEEAHSQQIVVDAWRATEYVVGGIELTPRLACELAWQWQADALPPPLREIAGGLAGRAQLLDRIPADAWLAVAGRIDLARIVRHMIAQEWRANKRSENIKPETILAWSLSAGLGPNFTAYCRSPSNHLAGPGPVAPAPVAGQPVADAPQPSVGDAGIEAVVAVQTRPLEPVDSSPSFAETAAPLVHALLAAAVEAANAKNPSELATIETTTHESLSVTAVSGLKAGGRPLAFAYAVAEGVFWLGTSADAVRHSAGAAPDESLLARAEIRRQLGSLINEPSDMFYIDLSRLRSLLAAGPEAVGFLWEGKSLDPAARRQQYETLVALSQLADRLLASVQIDTAGVSVVVSLGAGLPTHEVR
ncbi:MAG TPA: hypothetical protein VJ783_30720 [Pirellulales bacterium]|nr:hypothetical protein [Pirellulales bacterium]